MSLDGHLQGALNTHLGNHAEQAETIVTTLFNMSSVLQLKTLLISVWFWTLKKNKTKQNQCQIQAALRFGWIQSELLCPEQLSNTSGFFFFVCALFVCMPTRGIEPSTGLDCVQACLGVEQCY